MSDDLTPAADPRDRAFDYTITELWHWINNDYAYRGETDKAQIRVMEDTWIEIAQRLEAWKNEQPARDDAPPTRGNEE